MKPASRLALVLLATLASPALAAPARHPAPPVPPAPPAGPAPSAPLALPGMPPPPVLPDQAAYVLMDAATGAILAEKAPTQPWPPASLAKLMATYLAYQAIAHGSLKMDQPVTVSATAWHTGGSRMFLSPGQPVTIDQLLHGVLIDSGNDATVALAQAVAGTQGSFVALMNATAAKLGLTGTHYANPTGLPDPTMTTTARDVAVLSRDLLLSAPQVLHITAHKHYTFDKIRQRSWNPVLFHDPSVDGLKTGRTKAAGHCIDATALRNGRRLIAVVLGGPSWAASTRDIEALLDYGYHFYTDKPVLVAGRTLGTLTDPLTQPMVVPVAAAHGAVVTLPAAAGDPTTALQLTPPARGGIARGAVVGKVTVSLGGRVVAESPVVAEQAAPQAGFFTLLVRRVRAKL
ncbi:MAG: D-alanyl-D-alanine carboxypeptidase family protein [Acetobacteraceae bacterium]